MTASPLISEEIQNMVGVNDTSLAISRTNYVTMMEMFRMDAREAAKKFDHAARSLGEKVDNLGSGKRSRH